MYSIQLPSSKVLGLCCLYSYPEGFFLLYVKASLPALLSLALIMVPALCLLSKGRVKLSPVGKQMSEDTHLCSWLSRKIREMDHVILAFCLCYRGW